MDIHNIMKRFVGIQMSIVVMIIDFNIICSETNNIKNLISNSPKSNFGNQVQRMHKVTKNGDL